MKGKRGENKKEQVKFSVRDSIAATGSRNKNEVNVITDTRFSSVHHDPRFQEVPDQHSKVLIDKRFSPVLKKNFSPSKARVDKRGKRIYVNPENRLRRYYRLDKEENKKKKDQESDDGDENGETEKNENAKVQKHDNNILESDSNSESEELESADELSDDTSSLTGSDTDEDDGGYLEDEPAEPEENIPVTEQETHRLAIVNMDWSQVQAADLFVVMSSFLPKGGQIKSRMEEESVKGPVGLFDDNKVQSDDDDVNGEIDVEKLRAYENSRLRYYYAVVECDSSDTAVHLYENCDSIEFERASNVLDLRFIADSMEFKHFFPPRDIATEAPAKYEGIDFKTRALQHSNLDITWDEDEPQRTKLDESEMKGYVASDVSDDDDEDETNVQNNQFNEKLTKAEKYRVLFKTGDESSHGGDDEDGNKDMEVTFNTGLEDLSKRILEKKKNKDSETVWNLSLRKNREKEGKKERFEALEDPSEDKIPAVDYTDPRFENLYKSPLFALDPTDPQYKRSAAYARQVGAQKQNGVRGDLSNREELRPQAQLASDNMPGKTVNDNLISEGLLSSSKKEKFELSSLVRSIKSKSQQAQISSSDKRSRKR
ncbi:hypothetical protein MKW98_023052 [Papaver atlanticum]|uniref:NUC153 domain-containing protein n=1 Tax=Papaver atlanticum TaxID=357466 RepID=A0AAD4TAX6_9MAGN|nr:hypothetical protein MKW98_023052 [Papaver atlanticum]